MKTACALLLFLTVGLFATAQNKYTLPTGEQMNLTQYSDNANYSFTRLDAKGNLLELGSYKAGLPDGIWMNYNSDGTVSGTGRYVNGKKEGDWSFYSMQGATAYTVTFKEGKRINAVQLDERGNTLAETKTKE
jgi:antitoxin component YwqK of YwqJK toxin-antitoxin module